MTTANNFDFLKQELTRYRLEVQSSMNLIEQLVQENEALKKQGNIKQVPINYEAL
jgi:hypothetical protein